MNYGKSIRCWNNRKKQMHIFLQPMLHPLGTKAILTTTNACALVRKQLHANSNSNFAVNVKLLCKANQLNEAIHILHVMDHPDSSTYASLLQGCLNTTPLAEGKLIHAHIIQTGFKIDIYLETKLVIMYAKCGYLAEARQVMDEMPKRNVVTWTAMIAAYARHGYGEEALTLFYRMQRAGIQPDQFTFASVLPACANLGALEHGKEVHKDIIRNGFESDTIVGNALLDMYAKCKSIIDGRHMFDKMLERNVVSWNAMIAGYVQNGNADEAWKLLQRMQLADVKPNSVTFTSVLSACANFAACQRGKEVHESIIRSGFQFDIVLEDALIDMYAKCGNIQDARNVFDKMPTRDVVSWNVMVAGYGQSGHVDEAVKLFQKMPKRDMISWNAMIAVYAQNGNVDKALKLFQRMPQRNVVSWNAMISGYAQNGNIDEALKLFQKMPERNVVSWNAMLAGYAQNGQVDEALNIFQKMPERDMISWNTMIAVYERNGHVDEALKLFQKMPRRDMVSWNTMIAVYAQNGYFDEALKFFQQMQLIGVRPNSVTFASVIPACANLAALKKAKEVHEDILRSGFQSNVFVGSALVDMYAKCGSIQDAHSVFDKMPERNVVSWNAIIVGYSMHGCGAEVLHFFEQMQQSRVKPDHVTFLGVLSACCRAGLLDDGWLYFDRMSQDYHITPALEHYCCMVDLLGRAGHLEEAENFINKMPMKPDAAVWGSLLGSCSIHTNLELAERVAERLFELDPENSAHYVLLSNIYAAAGRWDDKEKVRKMMEDRTVKKPPGCSLIEVNNEVHTFLVAHR